MNYRIRWKEKRKASGLNDHLSKLHSKCCLGTRVMIATGSDRAEKTDSELELPGAGEMLTAILVLTHQSWCLELLIDSWVSLLEKVEVVFCV